MGAGVKLHPSAKLGFKVAHPLPITGKGRVYFGSCLSHVGKEHKDMAISTGPFPGEAASPVGTGIWPFWEMRVETGSSLTVKSIRCKGRNGVLALPSLRVHPGMGTWSRIPPAASGLRSHLLWAGRSPRSDTRLEYAE